MEQLSPFELKDQLIRYARDYTQHKAATHKFLNAGRGNPNWIATTPREAMFVLGRFGLEEARRVWNEPDLGGMPHADGIADRLAAFLARTSRDPGAELLRRSVEYVVDHLGCNADAFVHELVDAAIGDNYPEPDRMLAHIEYVVRQYLFEAVFDGRPPEGTLELFATEGGTAAMCYVFDSLARNFLLRPGDAIALGAPIFTPYIDLPPLYGLQTVELEQSETAGHRHTWQYPDAELEKLLDPSIKMLFLVNPSNPASFAMHPATQRKLVALVRNQRPDLMILTDDVYGTFVEGFRSLAADLPYNTILVYSFSKHFGCTGWRLGTIGLNEHNVFDRKLAELPEREQAKLRERYSSLTTDPNEISFIARIVADSRAVALNHTAGLSTPQQAQMALFSLFALLDEDNSYEDRCREIVQARFARLLAGLGIELPADPLRVGYYATFDLELWGRTVVGDDFVEYVKDHDQPIDVVIGLARNYGTVLLNGNGFDGPAWSVRVSLANLDADDYEKIGRDLRQIVAAAVQRWRDSKQ
jgi:aspartate 4-decarboxylase